MDKKDNISDIIWARINNSDDLIGELNSCSDEELFLLRKHLKNIKNLSSQKEPDWNGLWKRIESKTNSRDGRKKTLYNVVKYASLVAAVIVVSGLVYFVLDKKSLDYNQNQYSESISIEPGKKTARLILANGKVIDLENTGAGKLRDNKSVTISKDSNDMLAYVSKENVVERLEYQRIEVPTAGEYSVRLCDGTVVFLNSESELRYPAVFSNKERKVYLKGEAYFRVTKDVKRPFRVELEEMTVEVLGTSFNINAYAENEGVQATLVEGKVKVRDNSNEKNEVLLKPSQQAELIGNILTVKNVDIREFISWKDGKFYFKEMTMEKVMIQMERWFDIDVFFVNSDIRDYPFTGVINKRYTANEIFSIIEKITGFKIRQKGRIVYLEKRK